MIKTSESSITHCSRLHRKPPSTHHALSNRITEILLTMPQLMARRLGPSNVKQYPITRGRMLYTGCCSSHPQLNPCELQLTSRAWETILGSSPEMCQPQRILTWGSDNVMHLWILDGCRLPFQLLLLVLARELDIGRDVFICLSFDVTYRILKS